MQQQKPEFSLDFINEFLNTELNAGFERAGVMQNAYGTVEMTFRDRINNNYALVINDYTLKNRAEITKRVNTALKIISNIKTTNKLYLIFDVPLTPNDIQYFSDIFFRNSIGTIIYDLKFIQDRVNSSQTTVQHKSLKNESPKDQNGGTFSRSPKAKDLDFDLIARQASLASRIRSSSKSFWWINASKQFFEKQPIKTGDVYQYPIRINNGKRRANFSNLKIGDLLIGYDAKGTKEVYSILCVVREDDSFVFLKVVYILDKPISWKQVSEIESYSNSRIIRSKATVTLNKLSSDQFNAILLKGIFDPDNFLLQIIMDEELTSFKDEKFFEVNNIILEDENDKVENENIELNQIVEKNIPTIASFTKDTPDGEDYLDIKEDVDAFSKVMALRDLPTPLSIALFGAWGSGKSFFMHKLEERIKELTDIENTENEVFCKNIVHIKFNAWAYLDANLWASLASIIFEQMYYHLEEISKVDSEVQQKIKEVTDELDLVKGKKQKISIEINELTTTKTEIEEKIKSATESCNNLIENLLSDAKNEIVKKVFLELNTKERINIIISEYNLGTLVHSSTETYSELVKLANELKKIPFTFSGIFTRRSIFLLTIISLIVLTFLLIGFCFDFSFFNQRILMIPELIVSGLLFITPIFIQISNLLRKITPAITSINRIKTDVEDRIQSETKLRELEIEKNKLKLTSLKAEITSLEIQSKSIEFKIQELTDILDHGVFFETFKSIIHDIHSSKAYKKHLGIISQLKNDLDILSALFVKQLPELNSDLNNDKFVDRIILYLDDLDRCSEEHVIEVLEAVNLLLAYPLFVVVVGVDHRWVKNALITKYYKQFGMHQNVDEYERIEPNSYLEKIFQVPFHLNTPKQENVKYMIRELIKRNEEAQNPAHENLNKASINILDEGNFTSTIIHHDTKSRKNRTNQSKSQVNNDQLDNKLYTEFDSKMLVLTKAEIELLPEFDFLLGTNPRTIKRYVNIYRIVNAHGDLPSFKDSKQQKAVCMFLVALAIGECKSIFHKLSNMWHDDFHHFRKLDSLFDNTGIENKMRYFIQNNHKIKFLLDLDDSQTRSIGLFIERFSFRSNQSSHHPISLIDQKN